MTERDVWKLFEHRDGRFWSKLFSGCKFSGGWLWVELVRDRREGWGQRLLHGFWYM